MPHEQVLVIDAGTTGIRALVIDRNSRVIGRAYTEFPQYHPGPGSGRTERRGNLAGDQAHGPPHLGGDRAHGS